MVESNFPPSTPFGPQTLARRGETAFHFPPRSGRKPRPVGARRPVTHHLLSCARHLRVYNLPVESVNRSVKARGTWQYLAWAGVTVSLLAACNTPNPTSLPDATRVTSVSTLTPVPSVPPTPTITPEPLAARVNGEPITLAAFEKEEKRCRAGKSQAGLDPADCPALALQSLIEQKAVEQAAVAAGLTVSDTEDESALTQIVGDLGGLEAYRAWLAANLYSDDE